MERDLVKASSASAGSVEAVGAMTVARAFGRALVLTLRVKDPRSGGPSGPCVQQDSINVFSGVTHRAIK
jgi:hypothetical protein